MVDWPILVMVRKLMHCTAHVTLKSQSQPTKN